MLRAISRLGGISGNDDVCEGGRDGGSGAQRKFFHTSELTRTCDEAVSGLDMRQRLLLVRIPICDESCLKPGSTASSTGEVLAASEHLS